MSRRNKYYTMTSAAQTDFPFPTDATNFRVWFAEHICRASLRNPHTSTSRYNTALSWLTTRDDDGVIAVGSFLYRLRRFHRVEAYTIVHKCVAEAIRGVVSTMDGDFKSTVSISAILQRLVILPDGDNHADSDDLWIRPCLFVLLWMAMLPQLPSQTDLVCNTRLQETMVKTYKALAQRPLAEIMPHIVIRPLDSSEPSLAPFMHAFVKAAIADANKRVYDFVAVGGAHDNDNAEDGKDDTTSTNSSSSRSNSSSRSTSGDEMDSDARNSKRDKNNKRKHRHRQHARPHDQSHKRRRVDEEDKDKHNAEEEEEDHDRKDGNNDPSSDSSISAPHVFDPRVTVFLSEHIKSFSRFMGHTMAADPTLAHTDAFSFVLPLLHQTYMSCVLARVPIPRSVCDTVTVDGVTVRRFIVPFNMINGQHYVLERSATGTWLTFPVTDEWIEAYKAMCAFRQTPALSVAPRVETSGNTTIARLKSSTPTSLVLGCSIKRWCVENELKIDTFIRLFMTGVLGMSSWGVYVKAATLFGPGQQPSTATTTTSSSAAAATTTSSSAAAVPASTELTPSLSQSTVLSSSSAPPPASSSARTLSRSSSSASSSMTASSADVEMAPHTNSLVCFANAILPLQRTMHLQAP